MKLLTSAGELILDPFSGSNTTGRVAESLERRWIAVDSEDAYVRASAIRFGLDPHAL